MTWRQFLALMRGLSPHSATVTASAARQQMGGAQGVNTVSGPKAAQAAFVALFGSRKGPELE